MALSGQCVVWSEEESHLNDCRLTCLPEACPTPLGSPIVQTPDWRGSFEVDDSRGTRKKADEMVSCKGLLQRGL